MRFSVKLLLAVVLSVCLSMFAIPFATAFGQEKAAAQPSFTPLRAKAKKEQVIAKLEQSVPQLLKDGDVPGLSIALLRNGELVWHHGFGVKNTNTNEPVTGTTVFEAASLSKPVFAYAVLKLVDAGKFDPDKPLNQYLPGNYDVGEDPRLGQITARHVLGHTPGFPNWRPQGGALKIHFTPGDRFSYSGEGFVYLSKVIEHVTGEKFNDLWLKYESYKSPGRVLLKNTLAKGAEAALGEYRQWRQGRAPGEVVNENQMNRMGYDLLGTKQVKDAIEVFKQNVADYPRSANTYDSLGEAYMINGDREMAIKNYERSIQLDPNNTNGVETLKKLRENKQEYGGNHARSH